VFQWNCLVWCKFSSHQISIWYDDWFLRTWPTDIHEWMQIKSYFYHQISNRISEKEGMLGGGLYVSTDFYKAERYGRGGVVFRLLVYPGHVYKIEQQVSRIFHLIHWSTPSSPGWRASSGLAEDALVGLGAAKVRHGAVWTHWNMRQKCETSVHFGRCERSWVVVIKESAQDEASNCWLFAGWRW